MKKFLVIFVIVVGSLVAISIILSNVASRYALEEIERRSQNIAGLALDVGVYDVGILDASIRLHDIKIYPTGKKQKKDLLASAKGLYIKLKPWAILKKTLHIERVTLVLPYINFVRVGAKKYNWDALQTSKKDKKRDGVKIAKGSDWRIKVDSVLIDNASLQYRDFLRGQRADIEELTLRVNDIVSGYPPEELPTSISLKANLGKTKGRISIKGDANFFADGVNFNLQSKIINAPIPYFEPFYRGKVPFEIKRGTFDIKGNANAKRNILYSKNNVRIDDLKTGGNAKGVLVDSLISSSKEPISFDVEVRGNLKTGEFSFSDELTKAIVGAIMRRAAKISPVKAVEAPLKTLKKGGSGMGGVMEKIFGPSKK